MQDYNYIDLFAGVGGFSLGAHMAGMKFKKHFASEIDPFCVELYQKRFPDSIQLGDINNIDCDELKKEYGDKWILTGGFPCQDISCAGKGEGIHGKRSGLWFEYWRLINDLRPRFAIMENVGMLIHRGLSEVLGSLAEIGYDAEWQDIRAEDMGAPHKRERIWIVAYPGYLQGRNQKQNFLRKMQKNELQHDKIARSGETRKISNSHKQHDDNTGHGAIEIFRERSESSEISGRVADSMRKRNKTRFPGQGKSEISDNNSLQKRYENIQEWWSVEPSVDRLAHGVSHRVDKLRGLGNAIVPQIAAAIWKLIKDKL